jgi:hypothetical protein
MIKYRTFDSSLSLKQVKIVLSFFLKVVEFYYRIIRNADYLVSSDSGATNVEGSADGAPESDSNIEVSAHLKQIFLFF